MRIKDFNLTCKGFFNKRKADDIRFGKVAFYIAAIHQNLSGKPIYMSRFLSEWVGEKPKALTKDEIKDRSSRMMERVRIKNKILEEKEKVKKLAKRTKNSN